jgi:sigma-B regulation protein RsbU (phosphoserine phosphatase)
LSHCRILLVDDVKDNITILIETLKRDYKLGFALNGPDALKYAKIKLPDLILLDIMMPDMDGYEVCRRLKADPVTRDIPVLFIMALDEIENKTNAFGVGAVDYITKPFELLEVKASVRTHLTLKLARQALADQRDRLQQSLDLAMEVQQSLLPKDNPHIPHMDIAGKSVYCDETGGDYYDFLDLGQEKIGIILGDVSGHGIQSALLMTTVGGSLRQRILRPDSLALMISDLNRQYHMDVEFSGQFMTLFICELDTRNRILCWVRAGHDPATVYDVASDTFFELGGKGLPLGVVKDIQYEESARKIENNQILVIGTDGIWESFDPAGKRFGKDRFKNIIRSNASLSAKSIADSILNSVQQFRHPLKSEDDITLVVIKFESKNSHFKSFRTASLQNHNFGEMSLPSKKQPYDHRKRFCLALPSPEVLYLRLLELSPAPNRSIY